MTNPSGIIPLDVKVLVKPDAVEEVTKGGIVVPESVRDKSKYAGTKATLVAAGPNAFKEWGENAGPPSEAASSTPNTPAPARRATTARITS
jgi:co-chaperonin GroES (HSP10)